MQENKMSDNSVQIQVETKAQNAKNASLKLRVLSSEVKDNALNAMAVALVENAPRIFEANEIDLKAGKEKGLSDAMLDRLKLTPGRIEDMADGCRQVAALPDPVNQVVNGWTRPNGLKIEQVRTPLGVVGIIYESRPNVTVDAAILCLKSGNAAILRGGSEAFHSNKVLWEIITEAAVQMGVPAGAIEFIETTDRAATTILAQMENNVDLLIPRGGEELKKSLSAIAKVPIIYAAGGVCHIFVDSSADLQNAVEIVINAKTQRPSTCNSLETLLIHQDAAADFLPVAAAQLQAAGVDLRGDEFSQKLVEEILPASEEDWFEEYHDLILAVKIVPDIDAAIAHIEKYGTHHSDSILTKDYANAERFCGEVDSAAVYVNASTRFTDGYEFGLGAEIGISTQKLHARGPLGLEALTSLKYVVRGQGQLRE
jgi:glutamate-5-semialdehyde dehydrogenase